MRKVEIQNSEINHKIEQANLLASQIETLTHALTTLKTEINSEITPAVCDANVFLEYKVEAFREIERNYKTVETQYKPAKKELIELIGEPTDVYNSKNQIIATLSQVQALTFNSAAFREDHGDIYDLYKRPTISQRLKLK